MAHPAPTLKTYTLVYAALLVLMVATVAVAYVELEPWNTPLALLIAFVKATLVVLFFMQVRYSVRLVWLVAIAGFIWLAILLGLTMSDYLTRPWLMP